MRFQTFANAYATIVNLQRIAWTANDAMTRFAKTARASVTPARRHRAIVYILVLAGPAHAGHSVENLSTVSLLSVAFSWHCANTLLQSSLTV